ncbi:related to glucan 1,3-beta-glucosidase [Ramularia collo-cygni]|uniref:glucan endo-1,3-beta-D-glucosidase n=1 Tax=Ramularia collo-cygni TaxID=112498 RepID=A0A2D3VGJ8_9PEZI|nr:related to glucan 1,3-beta-glucosidase [Ramularia collo-cygni]CZT24362.1 related to glucan 1,3-beta-glucosidase [Ramularia collo-cygni]
MTSALRCFRAAHVLSLITIVFQVLPSAAHPVLQDLPGVDSDDAETGNVVYQIPDGQIQAAAHALQVKAPQTSNVVYQIEDGQVQAPYYPGLPQATKYPGTVTLSPSCSTTSSTVSVTARDLSTSQISGVSADVSDASSTTATILDTLVGTESFSSESPPSPASVTDSPLTSLSVSEVQTGTLSDFVSYSASMGISTSLETSAQVTSMPFASISNATSTLPLVDPASYGLPTATSAITKLSASEIFVPIATGAPLPQIPRREDHPVPRIGIQNQTRKLQTNRFYTNLFMGNQTSPVYTFPYSVKWARGGGKAGSWGLVVSHTELNQFTFGPPQAGKDAGDSAYFASPLGLDSMILSAAELTNVTTNTTANTTIGIPGLTTDSVDAFSINVNLFPHTWQTPIITFPLVQGSAFITGVYHWAAPMLQTGVGFDSIEYVGEVVANTTYKYRATLQNGYTWLVYISPDFELSPDYRDKVNKFTLINGTVVGPKDFNGFIQVAKMPGNTSTAPDSESIYDGAAGAYTTGASISGTVENTTGSYTFDWSKEGVANQSLLLFALPHHLKSFSNDTLTGLTDLQLMTPVKGLATAIRGTSWTLVEKSLPIDMAFAPYSPTLGSVKAVSNIAAEAVYNAGLAELQQDVAEQTNVGSMYYDGKALAKFAAIVYTLHDLAGNQTLALSGLQVLQQAFALHVDNNMKFPLTYESAWGGVVSSAAYTGQPLDDFGNTYYNDHHFHFGYFVYAAAVIGYFSSDWLTDANVAWVNMLVRDFANPIKDDPYYPFSRNFDWYHGHSWASGLFESDDGKNQESSSEDNMASYALKMWGQVINDKNMEARGNLMLAIQARSFQDYYLYEDANTVLPAQFIGNKVAGILFENKIDHTTYFGSKPEYIQGIHMIPLMPFSSYIRTPTFVQEEWEAYFSNGSYIDTVEGGWRGILMANYAISNPAASYQFFSDPAFNVDFLDGGASLTWYLAYSAALGGASSI